MNKMGSRPQVLYLFLHHRVKQPAFLHYLMQSSTSSELQDKLAKKDAEPVMEMKVEKSKEKKNPEYDKKTIDKVSI